MLGKLSLKARLFWGLCAFGLLAVLAVAALTRGLAREQAARDQGSILSLNAQRVAARLDRQLNEHLTQLRSAAEIGSLRDPAASPAARSAALEAMRRADLNIKWAGLVSEGARCWPRLASPATTQRCCWP